MSAAPVTNSEWKHNPDDFHGETWKKLFKYTICKNLAAALYHSGKTRHWKTIKDAPEATILTVSRAVATRVNNIVIRRMFEDKTPLSSIALDNDLQEFLAFKHMHVVVMQDLDKRTGVVNGQLATIVNSQNNTLLLEFPNGKTTFTYPVTTTTEEGICRVHYALSLAYSMSICKTQGANIKKLIVWFDYPTVPKDMAYVALSRVCKSEHIRILTPMVADQLTPALS